LKGQTVLATLLSVISITPGQVVTLTHRVSYDSLSYQNILDSLRIRMRASNSDIPNRSLAHSIISF